MFTVADELFRSCTVFAQTACCFWFSGHRQDVRPRYPLVAPGSEGHAAASSGDASAEAGEDPAAVGAAGIGEGY